MRKKAKNYLIVFVCAICIFCAAFFIAPSVVLDASARSLTTTEQSELNRLLTYEIVENNENLFKTNNYNDVVSNISSYIYSFRTFKENVEKNNLDVSSQDMQRLEEKNSVADAIGTRLENYLLAVYFECNSFKNTAMGYDYNAVTVEDKDALQTVKNNNLKFWGQTTEEVNGEIYLTYAENAYRDESTTESGAKLATDARANIDNCLNKTIALSEYTEWLDYFSGEIAKLPAIVDITEKDREALEKLSKEINDYCSNYAVHLDETNKTKFENFKWQVDKSLDRIKGEVNTQLIFYIALVVIIGFAIYVFVRYLIIPLIRKKFKGRKK